MKLYFAGPLFTTPERAWNAEVVAALRAARHEIFLPQEQEPGRDAAGIFATDVGGIDRADGLVAIMDGFQSGLQQHATAPHTAEAPRES
jgi:nucleoside 2-deoxyribosyltransferase